MKTQSLKRYFKQKLVEVDFTIGDCGTRTCQFLVDKSWITHTSTLVEIKCEKKTNSNVLGHKEQGAWMRGERGLS